jgi:hypothetical protein
MMVPTFFGVSVAPVPDPYLEPHDSPFNVIGCPKLHTSICIMPKPRLMLWRLREHNSGVRRIGIGP